MGGTGSSHGETGRSHGATGSHGGGTGKSREEGREGNISGREKHRRSERIRETKHDDETNMGPGGMYPAAHSHSRPLSLSLSFSLSVSVCLSVSSSLALGFSSLSGYEMVANHGDKQQQYSRTEQTDTWTRRRRRQWGSAGAPPTALSFLFSLGFFFAFFRRCFSPDPCPLPLQ